MGFIRATSTSSSTTASVVCSNCGKKGHTTDRCWAEGGGAQGKAPNWWYKAKRKTKKTPDAVSAAATSTSSTLPSATTDANTVTRAAETYILATAVAERDVWGSGSPQADLTLLSVDAEMTLNDILLDKRRSVLFVGEQANHRTLPLALGVARGSLNGVFATYYEKGGKAARLKDIISAMKQSRDSHSADYLTMHHDLEEFLTYLSGLGATWQTLSDHIYAWRADARYLSRFFDEHPDCPKDAAIWFQSPWRQRREGPVAELLRGFIQSASELQSSSGGIVILGTSTNMKYSPKYELDELILLAEQCGYTHFDCGGNFVRRMYHYGYYHRSGSGMPVDKKLRGTMILNVFVKPRKLNAIDFAPTILQQSRL